MINTDEVDELRPKRKIPIDSEDAKKNPLPEDNWHHRSQGMVCERCMFFCPKMLVPMTGAKPKVTLGRCRRHAPTISGWPVMFPTDWCGDFKLDEEKV